MYKNRLKIKLILFIFLAGFLTFLIGQPGTKTRIAEENPPEEGERLILPLKGEEEKAAPEEIWTLPGADAAIRVLLLDKSGSIYHETQEPDKEYPGEIICYEEPEGYVLVNEVNLEDYIKRVVPSEMPSVYSFEALKAQAVCARTYAVWQMQEYAYPEYKAHVDDSTSYQVYNNISAQESTDEAVNATRGQIMLYGDLPVKAYYFATSCGLTTDENIWEKGDPGVTPYIAGRNVGESDQKKDMSEEEQFESFILAKRAGDLEISEPWYRWNCYVPLTQIEENVKTWASVRAQKSADGILLGDGGSYVWTDLEDGIGTVYSAEILSRNTGGAAQELLIHGENGDLKIQYEYNIRLMLGIPGGEVHKNDGATVAGSSLLPSGYFVLEPVEDKDGLLGYQVHGGGLGHGAGMSQNGARILAEQGEDYETILNYFYEGIRLARLGES